MALPTVRKTKAMRALDAQQRAIIGRPTAYEPAFCLVAEQLGAVGKSQAQIAAALRVAKSTLQNWSRDHPDFASSLARAKTLEQAHWEAIGQQALNKKHFQNQVWRTSMAARFKDDYSESRNVTVAISLRDAIGDAADRAKDISGTVVSKTVT